MGHSLWLLGHMPQCAPAWLRHWCSKTKEKNFFKYFKVYGTTVTFYFHVKQPALEFQSFYILAMLRRSHCHVIDVHTVLKNHQQTKIFWILITHLLGIPSTCRLHRDLASQLHPRANSKLNYHPYNQEPALEVKQYCERSIMCVPPRQNITLCT